MPLTKFQTNLAKLLSVNRSSDSHLAGGAALHFSPNSKRYSNDLDFFHDSPERVAQAFSDDEKLLIENGYLVKLEMSQRGFIRAIVSKGKESTKIEWAHDSAWRFMPPIYSPGSGFQLHPIDLAVNKTLALAGREEPRDFVDILYINSNILPLGALIWAAVGKDPGFTPFSLLELLKRRGHYRTEDFARLSLNEPLNLVAMKEQWLLALSNADKFIRSHLPNQLGCLFYSRSSKKFVAPSSGESSEDIIPHFGSPGGVLPNFYDGDFLAEEVTNLVLV